MTDAVAVVDPRAASPWHAGEVAIQRTLGMADRMEALGGRVIRDHMNAQHRAFYPLLPFVVLGAVDEVGDPWATIRAGRPGFLDAADPYRLRVGAASEPADPAEAGLGDGAAVGLLGIELSTRRRNRLNGTIRRTGPDGFTVAVEQSFGNCPQYIRPRHTRPSGHPPAGAGAPPLLSDRLDRRSRALVERADTFFVASFASGEDGRRQVDVSHRGGPAGFVRVGAGDLLTIPDYSGNRFFNTLGNLVANPRAGLVFVDFATGALLQLTGRAEVLLDGSEIAEFPGAERIWRVAPSKVVLREGALPLRFSDSP